MPKSSSHKSHRSHKNSTSDVKGRSDSEDDKNSRERKPRTEGPAACLGPRVSSDAGSEKHKSSSLSLPSQEKELNVISNGDTSGEYRKKRKDRVGDSVVVGDWSGKDDLVDKKAKREGFESADLNESAKSKFSHTNPKVRSGRRHEASSEGNEESGSRSESAKRMSEKDSGRKESSVQYKDAKEIDRDDCKDSREKDRDYSKDSREKDRDYSKDSRERDKDYSKDSREKDRDYSKDSREKDRDYCKDSREKDRDYCKDIRERDRGYSKDSREKEREYCKDANERDRKDAKETGRDRGSERDKKVQDARPKRSDTVVSRKQASKICIYEEEGVMKMDMENADRRDRSGEKDKYPGDGRGGDDKRLSSKDEYTKNASYKDESHKEGRHRDKYRDDLDRDQRHRDEKVRDELPSRDHNSNRSDSNYVRDDNKTSESRYVTSKLQGGDHDSSPYVDDHGTKLKDGRGKKRYYDENDNHIDSKRRTAKEPHEDMEKNASCSRKFDSHSDRARLDYLHLDKLDSSLGSNQPKSSPGSSNRAAQDQNRTSSNQAGPSSRNSLPEETLRPSTASRGDHATVSGFRERGSESRSLEKTRTKESVLADELLAEVAASQYERTPKADSQTSPNPVAEKSTLISNRQFSDKTGVKHGVDIEVQKSSCSKDGIDYSNAKGRDDLSKAELVNSEPVSVGRPSFNRTGHISGSSPNHLHPPTPIKHGMNSPFLGSYEDDSRVQIEDRKANFRYKRISDHGMGRGQGNTWKNAQTWPSQVPNGFIPYQQGPAPPRFHPAIQQFSASPLFGVRPSIDLNHTRGSYQVHEAADRFSGHGRPFAWPNPVDGYPHQLQVWDGSNGAFGGESHIYGRPDWEMDRHLMSNRGWEMSADMWKGRNGNVNMEPPLPQESEYSARDLSDKPWVGQNGNRSRNEWSRVECLTDDKSEIKRSDYRSPENIAGETPKKFLHEKTHVPYKAPSVPETSKTPSDDNNVWFCCNYLSELDISLDLVPPELYKQCMDMVSLYNVSESQDPQDNKEVMRMAAKNRNHILHPPFSTRSTRMAANNTNQISHPPFSTRSEAVFEGAMSLYKKQTEGMKVMFLAERRDSSEASETQNMQGVICSEEKDSLEASESQKVEGVVCSEERDSSEASEAQKMEGVDDCSEERDSSEASEAQKIEGVDDCSEERDSSEASEAQKMEGVDYCSQERDSSEASEAQKMEGVDDCSEERNSAEASEAQKMEGVDNQISSAALLAVKAEAADNQTAAVAAALLAVKAEPADDQTAAIAASLLAVKAEPADDPTTAVDASLLPVKAEAAGNQTATVSSPATANLATNMGEERNRSKDSEGSYPGDAKRAQQSDAVHSVEGPEPREALTAECRVNVSRIHLSPGSTH